MFYSDRVSRVAAGSSISDLLIECFDNGVVSRGRGGLSVEKKERVGCTGGGWG